MAKEKLGTCCYFSCMSWCSEALWEKQERWPCGFTDGSISFAASSSRWRFNTSITFLAKHALGNVEISPIEEEEEEKEEKMVVMRELEPVPKESGTTATALHTRHHPNPDCPCHLTVPLYNLSGGCNRFRGINTPGHSTGCPSKRIRQCLAHRNELLYWRAGEITETAVVVWVLGWIFSKTWCLGVCLRSIISVSEKSGSFLPLHLVCFWPHGYFILYMFYTHRWDAVIFSETGILTKELLKITISFLTPNFLVSLTSWMDTSNLVLAGVGYTVWPLLHKLWL